MAPAPSSIPPSPATTASLPSTPSLGPIARVPPETLLAIFNSLLNLCATAYGRQAEAQRFLRVSQAFHWAYLLSDAAHECAVSSPAQARALVAVLNQTLGKRAPVFSLSIDVGSFATREPVEGLVAACRGSLREFSCIGGEGSRIWTETPLSDRLIADLARCGEMETFSIEYQSQNLSLQQTAILLTAWPRLQRLDICGAILLGDLPELVKGPPAQLVSLGVFLHDDSSLSLFAALVRASANTLRLIALEYSDSDYDALALSLRPAAQSVTSLHMRQFDDYNPVLSALPPVLNALPRLREIELPVQAIAEVAVADALIKYKSLDRLFLYTHFGDGNATAQHLIGLVKAVRVDQLSVGQEWWRWEADSEMAHVTGDYATHVAQWMQARAAEVRGLVGSLSFV